MHMKKRRKRMINTKRTELGQQLPLDTPFSVHIFPMFYCNFKCNYCLHSLTDEQFKNMNFKRKKMDMEVFKKAVDDMSKFKRKIKALIFAGHGEPLLHPEIDQMVRYANEKNVADRIEIVTNGSLLTEEMSDKLIDAGLDRLRVSLQGITSKKYKEISDVDISIEDLVNKLQYFYTHKKNTEMYVKVMDISLDSKDEFNKFKEIFEPISDIAAVEYTIPFVNEIDYSQFGELSQKCKQGNVGKSDICSMPFYMLVVYPDGNVYPCCSTETPICYGNVLDKSLNEIWNGKQQNAFLLKQLNGSSQINVCKDCVVPQFGLQEGDYLDKYKNSLINKYIYIC